MDLGHTGARNVPEVETMECSWVKKRVQSKNFFTGEDSWVGG